MVKTFGIFSIGRFVRILLSTSFIIAICPNAISENADKENVRKVEKDGSKDSGRENAGNVEKDAPKDAGKDNAGNMEKGASKDAGKDNAGNMEKGASKDAGKDNAGNVEKDVPKDAGKDNAANVEKDASKDAGKDNAGNVEKDASKDADDEDAMDLEEDGPKDAGKEKNEPEPDAKTLLSRIDSLRHFPSEGFDTDSAFINIDPSEKKEIGRVEYRVVSSKNYENVIAITMSDPPGQRAIILSLKNAMWFQKENMQQAVRISPAQRLFGEAANGDVVLTVLARDYLPTEIKKLKEDFYRLTLIPKTDSDAAYSRIVVRSDGKGKIQNADYYAISGKLLKSATFSYVPLKKSIGFRLYSQTISDAIRKDHKTRIAYPKRPALRSLPKSAFNPNNLLQAAKMILKVPLKKDEDSNN
ncbi:MAG: outer membrane lipoprotein-sorting protein [Oligoflexales bacterium]|nr:outer membrane lipoprotein-sorting protein [Oligoflexales bacterium]